MVCGCASSDWVKIRRVPNNPLAQTLRLSSWRGPQATPRTMQLLRRYDLVSELNKDPEQLLEQFHQLIGDEPSPDKVYALAELAYINGVKLQAAGKREPALDMYGAAVTNAYIYLFDPDFVAQRNSYDPQFRLACDLYNHALESMLRMICNDGKLCLSDVLTIDGTKQPWRLKVESHGDWRLDELQHFEFASDYQVQGLMNHYQTYGLGVPLIAVHNGNEAHNAGASFYPPGLSFPATAFLRVCPGRPPSNAASGPTWECTLEIYDSLVATDVDVDGRQVPLETDLTTPLAYCLNNPFFRKTDSVTRGLLNLQGSRDVAGVYMLQPYDPRRIPVLMVHGLWSSLTTWMEMFNDLRGAPELRDRYQFWFYQYPTGQPFWFTAAHLRRELAELRSVLQQLGPPASALDEMVLVAHSMGGLISTMQTVDSGDDYARLVTHESLDSLQAPADVKDELRDVLYFAPNRSIQRVITIATPYRGSQFSNQATQWLGHRFIRLPGVLSRAQDSLGEQCRNLPPDSLLYITTSIDALAPTSPILAVMRESPRAPWTHYHNILGRLPDDDWRTRVTGQGDSVVAVESAHLEGATSEIELKADHVNIHRHPRAVLEVRRILLEHLVALEHSEVRRLPEVVTAD